MDEQREIIHNRAGEEVDITNSSQFAGLLLERIHDPVTRSVLFGSNMNITDASDLIEGLTSDRLGGGAGIICVMYSTVNLVFVAIMTRWKLLYDDETWGRREHVEYFRNARFSKLFMSALGKEDITVDLQIFSLMELWVCMKKADDVIRSQFANIFNTKVENIGLILQDVRDALRNASYGTLDEGKYTLKYCNMLCYRLIRSFPFLRSMKISYPTDENSRSKTEFCIRYAVDFDEQTELYPNRIYTTELFVATEQQLVSLRGGIVEDPPRKLNLYLLTETSAFTGKLQHTYRSFDGERETRIETEQSSKEDDQGWSLEEHHDIREMRRFLSFSYKNIREFALILSDTLKNFSVKRKEVFDLCVSKYPKIIPSCAEGPDSAELYWDNIITLMLVEMGPSDFLEFILDGDSDALFDTVMENIKWRCLGSDKAFIFRANYDKRQESIRKRFGLNPYAFHAQLLSLRIRTILEAMGFDKQDTREMHPFEESLTFKFDNILSCVKTLDQYWQKSDSVNVAECEEAQQELIEIFRNIFLFLQIFYTALDRYAATKQALAIEMEREEAAPKGGSLSSDRSDAEKAEEADSEIKLAQTRHKNNQRLREAFANAGAEKYEQIKNQTLSQAFDGFCEMCERYNSFNASDGFNVSEEAKRLKYLITRNYICDVQKLHYFTDITLSNGEHSTIFKMLENLSSKYYRDESFNQWLGYFSDIFLFLIYNEDYNERGLYMKAEKLIDKDCDPIYPYLVNYYRENVDRDNLKKCAYRVPVPTGSGGAETRNQGFVVTLLTEEDFPASTYFCIPLRYGSSESWWINPFLIPRLFVRRMEDIIREKNKKKTDQKR